MDKSILICLVFCIQNALQSEVQMDVDVTKPLGKSKSLEDTIPVIEIKGEGKPMTAAQIRALEEATDGPQDIKIKHTWKPADCPRASKRKDFITFQYKGFLEDGKKFHQTYGNGEAIRIQLGTGMTVPGLDKGLKDMCDTELRKITVPWRLSRKRKSRTWKYWPSDEHWLVFDIEMIAVEKWTPELQFEYIDENNDTMLTVQEVTKHSERIRKDFGKHWHNEDIDNVLACTYFVKYFDANNDGKVTKQEYVTTMNYDMGRMAAIKHKPKGRLRDPDVAWILDFNNDGVVTMEELDEAPERLAKDPKRGGDKTGKEEL